LLQLADNFITDVATMSSKLAKHRGSKILDVQDVVLHLKKNWGIDIPGYAHVDGGNAPAIIRKSDTAAHRRRLNAVRKSQADRTKRGGQKRKRTD
jgi:transcription initiation factor TFIID subunit TAF12